MEVNKMLAFLPTDLFNDSPLLKPEKSTAKVYQCESSTNCTNGLNDNYVFPNRNQMKHKTTQELSNEEKIKRELQSFAKKKMSDYTIARNPIQFPQYPAKLNYYNYPQMPMMSQTMYPNQFNNYNNFQSIPLIPPKPKMTQDFKTPASNAFNSQSIRMNKRFRTVHQTNNVNDTQVNDNNNSNNNIIEEMSICQIIDKFGSLGFVCIIKTSKGSRVIQKKMNKIHSNEIDLILSALMKYLKEIMCDYYGNYFLQKLISCCNPQQRILIYTNIQPFFLFVANNSCGTHSIQSLIVLSNTKEEEALIRQYTEPNLLSLSLNNNSTHIIHKIIFSIPESRREYINNFLISNLINLTLHSNGICLIKAFISNNKDDTIAKMLIAIFELDTPKVITHQYGNFALQELIRKFGFASCNRIIKKIKDKIILYSSMKYSSNVIDFIISYSYSYNKEVFNEIITDLFFNFCTFEEMTKNKYGNFVLENAILLVDQLMLIKIKEFMTSNGCLNSVKNKEKKIIKIIKNVKGNFDM